MIGALSGPLAALGGPAEQAAKSAVNVVNASGGVLGHPVALDVEDDGGSPTTAVTKVQAALGSSTPPSVVLVGDISTTLTPLLPFLTSGKVASFDESPTGPSSDPTKNPYNFDMGPSTDNFASAFPIATKAAGATKVGILTGSDGFAAALSTSMQNAAQSAGLTVTMSSKFASTALDLTPQLEAIRATKPDYLWVNAVGASVGYLYAGLQQMGWTIPVLGDSSLAASAPSVTPPPTTFLGTDAVKNVKMEVYSSLKYSATEPKTVSSLIDALKAVGPINTSLVLYSLYDAVILASAGATAAKSVSGPAIVKAIEGLTPGGPPTGVVDKYNFSATSHSANVAATSFTFVGLTKLIDGQFGAPGS